MEAQNEETERIAVDDVANDSDEELECRVCRGPAEEGRPLIKPCKCSGTIGLVHQDCLVSWLEVTRGDGRCELCKTKFRFDPQYAENTPDYLPAHEVILGLTSRALAKWLPFALRISIALFIWLIVAPMLTACLYHGWMHRPSSVLGRWKRDTIPSDIVSGATIAAVVIISFLSLMSFADFLRIHWQQGPRRRPGLGEEEEADGNGDDDVENEDGIDESIVEMVRYRNIALLAQETMQRADGSGDKDLENEKENPIEQQDAAESKLAVRDESYLGTDTEEDDEVYPPDLDYDEIINNPPRVRDLVEDNIFRLVHEMDERLEAEEVEEEDREGVLWPQEEALPQDAFAQVDPAMLQDDQVDMEINADMEINLALDELLGLRGAFSTLVRNLLWLLAFNATYLGIFSFVPKAVGATVYSGLFNNTVCAGILKAIPHVYSENENKTTLSYIIHELNEESAEKDTTFRLPDIATVTLGYFSIAAVAVMFRYFWIFLMRIKKKQPQEETATRRPPEGDHDDVAHGQPGAQGDDLGENSATLEVALDATVSVVKVGVLLFLKMFLLPLSLGLCLDISTMPLFGHSLARRIQFAGADIFSFILLHWVAGITFMLLVTVFLLQLREVAHPDLLAAVIRPQEPQPDLLGNLMHETVLTHMKRMVLSLGIYAPLLTLHIYMPIRLVAWAGLGDGLAFYHLNFWHILIPQLQIPIELVIFHLSMLALLERYKNSIGGWQHAWMVFMCKRMGLTEHMLPRTVDQFQLVGTKRVFLSESESDDQVDPFWYELASKEESIDYFVVSNMEKADASQDYVVGDSKANGTRVLDSSLGFIQLPERTNSDGSFMIRLLPTKCGSFCLKQSPVGSGTSMRIEFWKEIPGDPIPRPPEGWDDLGAGGAYVQGRWAWGKERRSVVEGSVAKRKPFRVTGRHRRPVVLMLKVAAFFTFSWIAITSAIFGLTTAPLAVGRSFYYLFRIPEKYMHDPFAFCVGAFVFFPCMSNAMKIMKKARGNPIQSFRQWVSRLHLPPLRKLLLLLESALLWSGVAPLALGVTYELVAVKPSKWFMLEEEPLLDVKTTLVCWLVGVVVLNLWALESYTSFFTQDFWANFWNGIAEPPNNNAHGRNNANAGDGAARRGSWQGETGRVAQFFGVWRSVLVDWEWEYVDRVSLLDEFARPIARQVTSALVGSTICWQVIIQIAPNLLSSGNGGYMIPLFGQVEYGIFRMVAFRLCAVVHVGVQLCTAHRRRMKQLFRVAHDAARDDRYLVGEILMNYDASQENNQ